MYLSDAPLPLAHWEGTGTPPQTGICTEPPGRIGTGSGYSLRKVLVISILDTLDPYFG